MPIIVAVLILSITALAAVFIIAWLIVDRVTRPGVHTYWDDYTFLPSDMGVPFETVRFRSGDNLELVGWLMPKTASKATIILVSGYRDRKTSLLPIAAGLWRHGFNVFLVDLRNQGQSAMDTVQTMGWREVDDMLVAVDEVVERLPNTIIGALGWSMGAAVILMAAARDRRIAAIVSDSAYAHQTSILDCNFRLATGLPTFPFVPLADLLCQLRAGYRPSRVRPEDVVGSIAPRPILFIHGGRDDLCPVENVHRLYARAGEPKELWLLPEAKHVGAYFADSADYIERVAAFFRRNLITD